MSLVERLFEKNIYLVPDLFHGSSSILGRQEHNSTGNSCCVDKCYNIN